jgi:hypothetical protein
MTNEVLNWPCRICGVLNRYHEVFVHSGHWIEKQNQLYDAPKLVSAKDHYADPPLNNLEYLEFLYESRTSR